VAAPKEGYTWLDHTADIGVVVRARSLEALFEVAAEALTDVITDRALIRERSIAAIQLVAPDLEQLLVRWLTELLGRFDIEGALFHRFSVHRVDENGLDAEAYGEPYDPRRHVFRTSVKAVTYHRLSLERTPDGWQATLIFDL
jgi:protein archease